MTCFALLLGPDGLVFRFQMNLLFNDAIDMGIPFYIVGILEGFGTRYHIANVGYCKDGRSSHDKRGKNFRRLHQDLM